MKCLRCGKESLDDAIVCEECGFNFKEHEMYLKYIKPKEDDKVEKGKESDLIDNPILTFVFGLLSMMIPIFLFSFLAFRFYKKPSKAKLIPLKNVGNIMAYIGVGLSIFIIIYAIISIL
ncbi:MAG: hypothetical protein ACOX4W_05920 [Bacilli bacterium]|jgi:DNA-directed RNA polymerase subunit RPC12/RpoP